MSHGGARATVPFVAGCGAFTPGPLRSTSSFCPRKSVRA